MKLISMLSLVSRSFKEYSDIAMIAHHLGICTRQMAVSNLPSDVGLIFISCERKNDRYSRRSKVPSPTGGAALPFRSPGAGLPLRRAGARRGRPHGSRPRMASHGELCFCVALAGRELRRRAPLRDTAIVLLPFFF